MIKFCLLVISLSINFVVYARSGYEKTENFNFQKYSDSITHNSAKTNSYLGFVEPGYTKAVGNYGINVLKINIINGYRFNQNFSIGFGTGARYYREFETVVVPLFTELRANFTKGNMIPYGAFGAGYTFNVIGGFKGIGALVNPSVGVGYKLKDKSIVNISVGYELQILNVYTYYGTKVFNSSGISFLIGFSL